MSKRTIAVASLFVGLALNGPASAAPADFGPDDIAYIANAMGFQPLSRPVRAGLNFTLRALGPDERPVRLVIDGHYGRILSARPIFARAPDYPDADQAEGPPGYGPPPYGGPPGYGPPPPAHSRDNAHHTPLPRPRPDATAKAKSAPAPSTAPAAPEAPTAAAPPAQPETPPTSTPAPAPAAPEAKPDNPAEAAPK